MSDGFNPANYRDEYRERVQGMLEEKSKGGEITVAAPEAPQRAQIIDLMQALKQSIEKAKPKQKAAPAQRKRKTASSDPNIPLVSSSIAPLKRSARRRWGLITPWAGLSLAGLELRSGNLRSMLE